MSYYFLIYYAGAGGTITGATPQTIATGGSGTAVTAVADEGYCFANWSDGSTDNPRTDADIQHHLTVTANFFKGLISRVAILCGSDWFYLPPYNLDIAIEPIQNAIGRMIPFGGMAFPYAQTQGWTIAVSGLYAADDVQAGLLFQDALSAALTHKNMDFCRYVDTTAAVNRIYQKCMVTTPLKFGSGAPGSERMRSFTFGLTSGDPAIYNVGANSTYPPVGPYEDVYLQWAES
jgi:hypothetical protein